LKTRKTLALIALLATSACMETSGTAENANAATPLVGKTLTSANGTIFTFDGNGNVGGALDGSTIVGTYEADAIQICSTYSEPARLAGSEFCSVPDIDGDTVIFRRTDGSQSQPYTISG
jgi:hypothetical protein